MKTKHNYDDAETPHGLFPFLEYIDFVLISFFIILILFWLYNSCSIIWTHENWILTL